jgi:hypothetical protein
MGDLLLAGFESAPLAANSEAKRLALDQWANDSIRVTYALDITSKPENFNMKLARSSGKLTLR